MASEYMDRISELPESLLHQILSMMPIKDAARTSTLSKRWNCIWQTLPFLNFGLDFYSYNLRRLKAIKKNRYLLKVANKIILSRYPLPVTNLQKLCLIIPEHEISRRRRSSSRLILKLQPLIRTLAKSELMELFLKNDGRARYRPSLPSTILLPRSIKSLHVSRFGLTSLSPPGIKLSSLQNLHLDDVNLEDHIMEELSVVCPLLETLYLRCCNGLKNLHLTGLRKLKRIELQCFQNLKMLKIGILPDLRILHMANISPSCDVDVETFAALQNVNLYGEFVTKVLFHQLVSQCLFLEELTIGGSKALEKIKISMDTIKKLRLLRLCNVVEVEIRAPILEKFCFEGYKRLPTLSWNPSDGLDVILNFSFASFAIDEVWHDELIRFLGYFNHVRLVEFLSPVSYVIIPKEKREGLSSPLCGVKNLVFHSIMRVEKPLLLELLECLICLSPQAKDLSIGSDLHKKAYNTEIVLKFLYEKEVLEESSFICSKFPGIECWRDSLSEVRIEKFKGEEDDLESFKNFFHQLENLKIAENLNISGTSPDYSSYDGLYTYYDELFSV